MSTLSQFFLSPLNFDTATASIGGIPYNPFKKFGTGTSSLAIAENPGSSLNINCGGNIISAAAGVVFIAAQSSAEVTRSWTSRNDANTRAQQVSGFTGWFVPTFTQLQNPGYICRKFWENAVAAQYWSSQDCGGFARRISFIDGGECVATQSCVYRVRSFRCVTY